MPQKHQDLRKRIKYFFKEYGATITGSITICGALYGAGFWTANINNSIKQNEITQKYNEELSKQKLLYNEMIRKQQIENDELRHQLHLLELNYKILENEGNDKNK